MESIVMDRDVSLHMECVLNIPNSEEGNTELAYYPEIDGFYMVEYTEYSFDTRYNN